MLNPNGESNNLPNGKTSRLGAVARERYESILQNRIQRCIGVQEARVNAHREEALQIYLEQNDLVAKLDTYRTLLEGLIEFFGYPSWERPAYLRDNSSLVHDAKVVEGINAILRGKPDLQPVFAELDRLKAIQEQITEKVWLAGAPEEIAELLKDIGVPPASSGKPS